MNWLTQSEEKIENAPHRERIKHRSQRGSGNFNWSHFYGFLESRVGNPVDRVIHEFVNCDWCEPRYRTFRQFSEGVEMHTFKKADGKIYYFCGWSNGQERCVETDAYYFYHREHFFYIHPETRLLCLHKKSSRIDYETQRRAERKAKVRILGDYHQLYKLNGTWYELKAEPIPENSLVWNKERKGPHDLLLEPSGWGGYGKDKDPYVKVTVKRQIGSKELKRHGLKNDLPEAGIPRCSICGGFRCVHYLTNKWKKEGVI